MNTKRNIKLLGISGKKRSGKNQVATFINEILEEKYNEKQKKKDAGVFIPFQEKAYAALVKKFASMLTGVPLDGFETEEDKAKELGPEWMTFNNLGLKTMMTRRLFLQKLGTNACNMNLHKNTWINGLFQDWTPDQSWLITDVRFPQEVSSIKERNGVIIRVRRPSTENHGDTHASETSLDNYTGFDYTIINDGTLDELRDKVANVLFQLKMI